MESVDIDTPEHSFIENVIQNMYIGNYSDNDYEEWLKDHDFEEDVFEIPEVSAEEEENYKVQCRKAIESRCSTISREWILLVPYKKCM